MAAKRKPQLAASSASQAPSVCFFHSVSTCEHSAFGIGGSPDMPFACFSACRMIGFMRKVMTRVIGENVSTVGAIMELGQFGKATVLSKKTPLTQKRVVEAATKLFSSMPIKSVSVRAIAEEAGLSRRAVYDIIDNRDDLIKWVFDPLFDVVTSNLPFSMIADKPEEDRLDAYAVSVLRLLKAEPHRRIRKAIELSGPDHPWLAHKYDKQIRQPLHLFLKRSVLVHYVTGAIDLTGLDLISARFHAILESYAFGDLALAGSVADANSDKEITEFVTWFAQRHFSRSAPVVRRG